MTTTTATVVQCQSCGKKNRVPAAAGGVPGCGNCGAGLPWIADADDDTFSEVADSPTIPVLVDFWAPWCAPCRELAPLLEKLAEEHAGKFVLAKINIEEQQELAAAFGVQSIPYVVAVKDEQLVDQFVGLLPEDRLREWIARIVPSTVMTSETSMRWRMSTLRPCSASGIAHPRITSSTSAGSRPAVLRTTSPITTAASSSGRVVRNTPLWCWAQNASGLAVHCTTRCGS